MVGRTLKVLLIVTLLFASTAVGFGQHPRYRFSVVAAGLDRPVGITVEGSETIYFTLVPTPGVGGGAALRASRPRFMPATSLLSIAFLRSSIADSTG